MNNYNSITDYTEQAFIDFMKSIYNECCAKTDHELRKLLTHFRMIVKHPAGTDLIFYPDTNENGTPEGITMVIKKWLAENGKPGFKED